MSFSDDAQLNSDEGMDYTKLRDLLKTGNWKDADEETRLIMSRLSLDRWEKIGLLDFEPSDTLPFTDFCTIDQLWLKYSNGKFGFSVQKRIYQDLGGLGEYNSDIWKKFMDKVGWGKRGQDVTFDIKSPEGHLPAQWWFEGNRRMVGLVVFLKYLFSLQQDL